MTTAISRADISEQLTPGLRKLFGTNYSALPDEFLKIYESATSDQSYEEDLKTYGFGLAKMTAEGTPFHTDTDGESYKVRVQHLKYTLGFTITQEAIDDNVYAKGAISRTKDVAKSMKETKNVVGIGKFEAGFDTELSGDGVTFFNTAHPLRGGQTIANRAAVPSDLHESAVVDAQIRIGRWRDDRGRKIVARVDKILVPVEKDYQAKVLFGSSQKVGSMDNDINALKGTNWETLSFLEDPDAWYIKTSIDGGAVYFRRQGIKHVEHHHPTMGSISHLWDERYSFMLRDFLGFYGNPGI
jgi:hypothetical protein